MKDPYFKRLAAQDKKSFWNIFKGIPSSAEFKDLFEIASRKDPEERPSLEQIINHRWMDFEKLGEHEFKEEILRRFEVIDKTGAHKYIKQQCNKNNNVQKIQTCVTSFSHYLRLYPYKELRLV